MADSQEIPEWRVLTKSVKGASHKHQDLPNQDAVAVWQPSARKLPLILAVSDGHGSAKSFRSDVGSELAVKVAVEKLQNLAKEYLVEARTETAVGDTPEGAQDTPKPESKDNLHPVWDFARTKLLQELVAAWKEEVKENFEKNPFTDEDLNKLEQKAGISGRKAVEQDTFLAYGATLLAVLVTEKYILYLQLGDGDILCVDTSIGGETTRPFPRDENLIANETYSLCMRDAWQNFQEPRVVPLDDSPPMILVSTDGYANSYACEEDFVKIGKDYLEMIHTQGCKEVDDQLETILKQTSHEGSGDDITLGIIKRLKDDDLVDQVKKVKEGAQENRENVKEQERRTEELEKNLENDKQKIQVQEEKITSLETRFQELPKLKKRILWLQKGLIASICLVVISLISNIALWLLPARTPADRVPTSTSSS